MYVCLLAVMNGLGDENINGRFLFLFFSFLINRENKKVSVTFYFSEVSEFL